MRRVLIQLPASVRINGLFAVDVHLSVRVDGDDYLADEGVDTTLLKPVETEDGVCHICGQESCILCVCRHVEMLNACVSVSPVTI